MALSTSELARNTELASDFLEAFVGQGVVKPSAYHFTELDESAGLTWFHRFPGQTQLRNTIRSAGIRVLDICFSATALVVLSPFILLTALAIRLESPGTILFKQIRNGKQGQPFTMLKFRSMAQNSDKDGIRLAVVGDARVTRVGHVIRRSRIDEWPQFINVLRGEMSIVGPRPEIPALAEQNWHHIPDYFDREVEKPGITGLAQVLKGYDEDIDGVRRTVALDKYFIQHRCLRNYVKILLRTVPVVFTGKGAI